jgi:hypothetical protein
MPRVLCVSLLAAIAALSFAACGGNGGDEKTPEASATPAATSVESPAVDAEAIRSVDLASQPAVDALVSRSGGVFREESVLFGDVTGDGVEEAVVPVAPDGTQGASAFVVLTPAGSGTASLLEVAAKGRGGLGVSIEDGDVVALEPVYGPDDPECCPGSLQRSVYAWDGEQLALASQTTEAAPGGGIKGTPSPE